MASQTEYNLRPRRHIISWRSRTQGRGRFTQRQGRQQGHEGEGNTSLTRMMEVSNTTDDITAGECHL